MYVFYEYQLLYSIIKVKTFLKGKDILAVPNSFGTVARVKTWFKIEVGTGFRFRVTVRVKVRVRGFVGMVRVGSWIMSQAC